MDEFKKTFDTSKIFQMLQRGKDDLLKGLSKDVMQSLLLGSLERLFELLSQHELEIAIRIKKRDSSKVSSSVVTTAGSEGEQRVGPHVGRHKKNGLQSHSIVKKNSP